MELPEIVVVIVGRVALRAAHQSSADRHHRSVELHHDRRSRRSPTRDAPGWRLTPVPSVTPPDEQGTNAPGITSETSRRLKVSLVAITVSVPVARVSRSKVWED